MMWRRFKDSMNKPFVGLYALYDDGLVYIGHSTDVPKRIKAHDKKHQFAKYKKMDSLMDARELEQRFIRKLKPIMNKDFTKANVETKAFSCALELDVWKAIKIKHAVRELSVADIVNQALREQLRRWVEIGNKAG